MREEPSFVSQNLKKQKISERIFSSKMRPNPLQPFS
jgi:hypothetical protein